MCRDELRRITTKRARLVYFNSLYFGHRAEMAKLDNRSRAVTTNRAKSEKAPALVVTLRPAKPGDYFFALDLYLDGAKRHLSKIGRWDRRRMTERFRRGYRQFQTRVIQAGPRDIGWVQIAEQVGRLHLRQLHLISGFRGKGVGTWLIRDLFERATTQGKPVTLEVMHGNPAKRLYERLGFKRAGRDADKIHMIWRSPRARWR
jgi:ribosomal protein S18 acetylase RimI-like enzyme